MAWLCVDQYSEKLDRYKAVSTILHHSYPYFIYEVIMKYIWAEYEVVSKNEVVNTAMFVFYQNILKLLLLISN